MQELQAAPQVLLSPALLDTITAYQAGCCEDMLGLARRAKLLKKAEDQIRWRSWWHGEFLGEQPFASLDQALAAWYAEVGLSRLTKLFTCMPRMPHLVVAHAVYSGNMSVLERLPVDDVRVMEMPLLNLAAFMGHLDVLKYLHEEVGHTGCTTRAVDSAALHGHHDIVAYLLANRREGCTRHAVEGAARNGHLDVLKFFRAHDTHHPSFDGALENAVLHDQLAIVSYILDVVGPPETNSTILMDRAAENGYLDMVKFLHEHSFNCSTLAMDGAALYGHLDVVKWLHENRTEGCTAYAMDDAACSGHWDVVQWLCEQRQEGCARNAIACAVQLEQWNILPLLATRCDASHVEDALELAETCREVPPDVVANLKSIKTSKQ